MMCPQALTAAYAAAATPAEKMVVLKACGNAGVPELLPMLAKLATDAAQPAALRAQAIYACRRIAPFARSKVHHIAPFARSKVHHIAPFARSKVHHIAPFACSIVCHMAHFAHTKVCHTTNCIYVHSRFTPFISSRILSNVSAPVKFQTSVTL